MSRTVRRSLAAIAVALFLSAAAACGPTDDKADDTSVSTASPSSVAPSQTTPSVAPTTTPASPATPSRKMPPPLPPSSNQTVLNLNVPIPNGWSGAMSEATVRNFVDNTTCHGDNAECPHVYFFQLPEAAEMQTACLIDIDLAGMPAADIVQVDGAKLEVYQVLRCADGKPPTDGQTAWYFADRRVIVTAGKGVPISTMEAVLGRAK